LSSITYAGSHLHRGNSAEPESLDPSNVHTIPAFNIVNDLFDGLILIDSEQHILPSQASCWKSYNKDLKWIFELRNSKWSDGQPVTAHDFVYAWRRIVNPKIPSPSAGYFELLNIANTKEILSGKLPVEKLGITAISDHILEITLHTRTPWFIMGLAHPSLFPVPKNKVITLGAKWTEAGSMVSNGKYTLYKWKLNEKIELNINQNHPQFSKKDIQQVTYYPLTSSISEFRRYEAGELHITSSIPTNYYHKLKLEHSEELQISKVLGTEYYACNIHNPPLNQSKIRQALSLSIDRIILTQKVLNEGQIPALSFAPPYITPMLNYQSHYPTQQQAIKQAQQLYKESGFSPQNSLKVSLLYNSSESRKKTAIAIAGMWKKHLGITVKHVNQEWKSSIETIQSGQFELARASWIADYNEASSMYYLFKSDDSNNKTKFKNEQLDRLLEKIKISPMEQNRFQLYSKIEKILYDEMPIIPLYHYSTAHLVSTKVKGYYNSPNDQVPTRFLQLIID